MGTQSCSWGCSRGSPCSSHPPTASGIGDVLLEWQREERSCCCCMGAAAGGQSSHRRGREAALLGLSPVSVPVPCPSLRPLSLSLSFPPLQPPELLSLAPQREGPTRPGWCGTLWTPLPIPSQSTHTRHLPLVPSFSKAKFPVQGMREEQPRAGSNNNSSWQTHRGSFSLLPLESCRGASCDPTDLAAGSAPSEGSHGSSP